MLLRRSITIALFVVVSVITQAQTNTYHAFSNNAIWRVDYYYDQPFQYPCHANYSFQYSLEGDTTINSLSFRKLYRSASVVSIPFCTDPMNPPASPAQGYACALRQDSVQNKVTIVLPNSTSDTLLFDYDLNVGDTLTGYIAYLFNENPMTVVSLDSVLINENYHTKWNFTPTPDNEAPYIIEGIGSSFGLIENSFTYFTDFMHRNLVCVRDSVNEVYTSNYTSVFGCNAITVGINNLKTTTTHSIAPNPFSNQTKLQLDKPLVNGSLALYNSFGVLVNKTEHLYGTQIIIDRNDLPSGAYYFCIQQDNKTVVNDKLMLVD